MDGVMQTLGGRQPYVAPYEDAPQRLEKAGAIVDMQPRGNVPRPAQPPAIEGAEGD